MAITNPAPVTPGVCNQLHLVVSQITPTQLKARLLPSDGTYALSNQAQAIDVLASADTSAAAVITAFSAAVQATASQAAAPTYIQINQVDPPAKAQLVAQFAGQQPYRVADLAALAATNTALSAAVAQLQTYLTTKVAA